MKKSNKRKSSAVWLVVLILFICVAATTMAFLSRLDNFLLDDSGAISLMGDSDKDNQSSATQSGSENAGSNSQQGNKKPTNPGFEASDDNTVWSTNTKVEIFRISYENGEKVVTVQSDGGDKVIAPGTENSYVFKLKNTGDVALDYTVEIDAFCTPQGTEIPIESRVNRYDGKWVAGSGEQYADVAQLDKAEDNATLGAGRYTYYTLDWLWEFESGNDERDTALGNLATEQDLLFTIVIKTTATESANPNDQSGISAPQMGDNTHFTLLVTLAICSFVVMISLIIYERREKRRENAEAKKVEEKEDI